MAFAASYFKRYQAADAWIHAPVPEDLGPVVIIPVFNEPHILKCLQSLSKCIPPAGMTEVILLVNAPEYAAEEILQQNERSLQEIAGFAETDCPEWMQVYAGKFELPKKKAGPGAARKIAMDEALRRFDAIDRPRGLILSLDADCEVHPDYLTAADACFRNKNTDAAALAFAHPYVAGSPPEPIVLYELYLRYYYHACRYAGYPLVFYAIGSAMAVNAKTYAAIGGMNQRVAAEDFYFMAKLAVNKGLSECRKAVVYPSGRISHRVIFGTGPAVNRITEQGSYEVYTFESFQLLKEFLIKLKAAFSEEGVEAKKLLSGFPLPFRVFFEPWMQKAADEAIRNSATTERAYMRFFRHFDPLQLVRLMNHLADTWKARKAVLDAANALCGEYFPEWPLFHSACDALEAFRKQDF